MSANDFEARFFKLSKGATIALVAVIVAALAGAGSLTAALMKSEFNPKTVEQDGENTGWVDPGTGDGGGGDEGGVVPLGSGPLAAGSAQRDRTFADGEIPLAQLSPEPVETGEATPGTGESSPEGGQTAEPSPQPSPQGGSSVSLAGGQIVVPAPDPWEVLGSDEDEAFMGDGNGGIIYALVGSVDPATDAASLAQQTQDLFLPPDNYSQVQALEVKPGTPYGSMVSWVYYGYSAVYTDSQGSAEVWGNVWISVRQDGLALGILAENAPPEAFGEERWRPVVDGAFQSFAGV